MKIRYHYDDIFGKEGLDYIGEFSPHRLSIIKFEEDYDGIFNANEEEIFSEGDEEMIRANH